MWLTVNVVCGPQDEGFPTVLMSAATGCKLAKLGWNKIEHQNTFSNVFFIFTLFLVSTEHWKCHMYFSIQRSKSKLGFFTISLINGVTQFCITLTHWGRVTHICVGNLGLGLQGLYKLCGQHSRTLYNDSSNQIVRINPFTNITKEWVSMVRLNASNSSHNLNSMTGAQTQWMHACRKYRAWLLKTSGHI